MRLKNIKGVNYEKEVRSEYPNAYEMGQGIWVDTVDKRTTHLGYRWKDAWIQLQKAKRLAERNQELLKARHGNGLYKVPRIRFRPSYTR